MARRKPSPGLSAIPDRALIDAIEQNSAGAVRAALQAGANVNAKKGPGTALQLALRTHASEPTLCALIEAGADVRPMKNRLVWGICTGRLAVVRALIRGGADLHAEAPMGKPLIVAVERGFTEAAFALIEAGVDVNAGSVLETPLLAAIKRADSEISCTLIRAGADINRKDLAGSLPLTEAAWRGDARVVRALIDAGADVQAEGNVRDEVASPESTIRESVMTLIDGPADPGISVRAIDVNAPFVVRKVTPLIAAAKQGHADIVTALLQAGADVQARDGTGLNSLDWATRCNHVEITGLLTQGGARAEHTPEEQLLAAAERGDADAVARLITAGAPLETRDRRTSCANSTPLLLAAAGGHSEVVRVLLDVGADLAATDHPSGEAQPGLRLAYLHGGFDSVLKVGYQLGRSPLSVAAVGGHDAVVRMLIEAGAAVNAKDEIGFTALLLAARAGHHETLQVLLDAHAEVDVRAPDRATACMMAAESGHANVVGALIRAGAKVNVKANDGETALLKAVDGGHLEVVTELLAAGADVRAASALHPNVIDAARNASRWVAKPDGTKALERLPEEHRNALVVALIKAGAAEPAAISVIKRPRQPSSPRREKGAARPNFARASRRSTFQVAVGELSAICGTEPQPLDDAAGGFSLHVRSNTRIDTEQVQQDFLERGVYVYEPTHRAGGNAPERLAVLPTRDKYKVIAYMGTNGANCGVGTEEVIRWLRQLEARQPFVLTGIGGDFLAGRFLAPVKKPKELAEQMYEFCPDIVDQGCGSVSELANHLRTKRTLYFWWD
jgi:ankyrin repeat protein